MSQPRRVWDIDVQTTIRQPAEDHRIPSPLDSHPPGFVTENLRTRWFSACRRQANTSPYRYSVAPSCSLYALDGRHLREGQQVRPQDVGWGALTELIRRMVVCENTASDGTEPPPQAA